MSIIHFINADTDRIEGTINASPTNPLVKKIAKAYANLLDVTIMVMKHIDTVRADQNPNEL